MGCCFSKQRHGHSVNGATAHLLPGSSNNSEAIISSSNPKGSSIRGGASHPPNPPRSKVQCKIVKTSIEKANGDSFVAYHIQLINSYQQPLWVIIRRYDDFIRLYDNLKKNIPKNRLPDLPSKKLFGNLSESFINERKQGLERCLTALCADKFILQDPAYRKFLSDLKQDECKGDTINPLLNVKDFKLLRVVGKGSYAKVLQVRLKRTGKIYAMKILSKQHLVTRNVAGNAMIERNILADLRHPFIVQLHYAFQTHDKLYLLVDFFNGGELFLHLRRSGMYINLITLITLWILLT